jgi:hypothetical protein
MRPLLVFLALALVAPAAGAQTMRSMSVSRQLHGETRLRASIAFGAGEVSIQPAPDGTLYAADLTWDADRFVPRTRYDAAAAHLAVALEPTGGAGVRVVSARRLEQRAVIALSPATELDLDATVGAADATLELGGLRIAELRVRTDATRATVRFSRPNPGACSRAEFRSGAAELAVVHLGDAGCRGVRVEGGVGTVTLDLAGAWPAEAELDVSVTLGSVRLRVPRDLGVRLTLERFAASFQPAGFTREGDAWVSAGYASAARKLAVRVAATVGGVAVERVE